MRMAGALWVESSDKRRDCCLIAVWSFMRSKMSLTEGSG